MNNFQNFNSSNILFFKRIYQNLCQSKCHYSLFRVMNFCIHENDVRKQICDGRETNPYLAKYRNTSKKKSSQRKLILRKSFAVIFLIYFRRTDQMTSAQWPDKILNLYELYHKKWVGWNDYFFTRLIIEYVLHRTYV